MGFCRWFCHLALYIGPFGGLLVDFFDPNSCVCVCVCDCVDVGCSLCLPRVVFYYTRRFSMGLCVCVVAYRTRLFLSVLFNSLPICRLQLHAESCREKRQPAIQIVISPPRCHSAAIYYLTRLRTYIPARIQIG
jgi:hypothetical protein